MTLRIVVLGLCLKALEEELLSSGGGLGRYLFRGSRVTWTL